jgi:hypothetical protein
MQLPGMMGHLAHDPTGRGWSARPAGTSGCRWWHWLHARMKSGGLGPASSTSTQRRPNWPACSMPPGLAGRQALLPFRSWPGATSSTASASRTAAPGRRRTDGATLPRPPAPARPEVSTGSAAVPQRLPLRLPLLASSLNPGPLPSWRLPHARPILRPCLPSGWLSTPETPGDLRPRSPLPPAESPRDASSRRSTGLRTPPQRPPPHGYSRTGRDTRTTEVSGNARRSASSASTTAVRSRDSTVTLMEWSASSNRG